MIVHLIKSFIKHISGNRFFYSLNLIGYISGFLVLTTIYIFVHQELSFDRFHKNSEYIFRIHSGGYGVTPLCFADKLKNQIPEIKEIIRFSSGNLTIIEEDNEFSIDKLYFTDPWLFNIFSFKLVEGDPTTVLLRPFSIVIDKTLASKLYGDNPRPGGILQSNDGNIFTVTGIMEDIPYNSHIKADAFVSMETLRISGNEEAFNCGSWSALTYLYLAQNSNTVKAEEKINSLLSEFLMGPVDSKIPLVLQPMGNIYFDYQNNKYDGSEHGNRLTVILYIITAVLILAIVIIANIASIPVSILVMKEWFSNFYYKTDIGFLVFIKTFLVITIITILIISYFIVKVYNTNLSKTLKYE